TLWALALDYFRPDNYSAKPSGPEAERSGVRGYARQYILDAGRALACDAIDNSTALPLFLEAMVRHKRGSIPRNAEELLTVRWTDMGGALSIGRSEEHTS